MSKQRTVSFFRCVKILYHQKWLSCTDWSEGCMFSWRKQLKGNRSLNQRKGRKAARKTPTI